jgi:hypothetical protein
MNWPLQRRSSPGDTSTRFGTLYGGLNTARWVAKPVDLGMLFADCVPLPVGVTAGGELEQGAQVGDLVAGLAGGRQVGHDREYAGRPYPG